MDKLKINCSFCNNKKLYQLFDFGSIPHVNKFYKEQDKHFENFYPLALAVCNVCFLIQLTNSISNEDMFIEYHHRSSASQGNKDYLNLLSVQLSEKYQNSKILEIGSNDLTLFNILKSKKINIFGVEPAKNLFSDNERIFNDFLNKSNAISIKERFGIFDLVFGINVFAHNSNFKELFESSNILLKENGVLHIEVAYALRTILEGNYDTIYHEHFCSYTLTSLENILNFYNFKIIDAEELNTQGGSLRVVALKSNEAVRNITTSKNYRDIKNNEIELGLNSISFYEETSKKISNKFNEIKKFFEEYNDDIVFIGAPGRGVVTLNSQNLKLTENISIIDDTPEKIGLCFPGLPFIVKKWSSDVIKRHKTAFILSWNYSAYLIKRLKDSGFKGTVVIPFPDMKIIKI